MNIWISETWWKKELGDGINHGAGTPLNYTENCCTKEAWQMFLEAGCSWMPLSSAMASSCPPYSFPCNIIRGSELGIWYRTSKVRHLRRPHLQTRDMGWSTIFPLYILPGSRLYLKYVTWERQETQSYCFLALLCPSPFQKLKDLTILLPNDWQNICASLEDIF